MKTEPTKLVVMKVGKWGLKNVDNSAIAGCYKDSAQIWVSFSFSMRLLCLCGIYNLHFSVWYLGSSSPNKAKTQNIFETTHPCNKKDSETKRSINKNSPTKKNLTSSGVDVLILPSKRAIGTSPTSDWKKGYPPQCHQFPGNSWPFFEGSRLGEQWWV